MRIDVLECHPAGMARTVVIVDDHDGFRAQARVMLARAGYDVVREAPDGASAVRASRELRPDLVLLDVQLPDMTGFEVARRVFEETDPPAVVLISSREASDYGARVGRSGARGFITKAELSIGALEAVLEGSGP
jgi:DNA-binding NarL/FixJ family response regulator